MRARLIIAATPAFAFLLQCAGAAVLDADEQPDAGRAYLFGRFHHRVAEHGGKLGLALRNANTGTEYIIVFQGKNGIAAVPARAGTYKITEVVYLTGLGREKGRRLFLPPSPFRYMSGLFTAPAGVPTYLGDFGASTLTRGKNHIWRFHSINDRFEKTRAEMEADYPLLRSLSPPRRAFRKP